MTYLIYILAFAVLLGVLVTIHEFGHFIVARMCKVHVQRFSIGMGPVFYKKLDKRFLRILSIGSTGDLEIGYSKYDCMLLK